MDKIQLSQLIGAKPQPEGLKMLEQCLAEYPYFQSAEILRLLHLQSVSPDKLTEALNHAAFLVPNRRVMHTQIHTQDRPFELLFDSNEQYAMPERSKSSNIDDLFLLLTKGDIIEPSQDSNDLIDQFLQNLPNLSSKRPTAPSPLDEQPANVDMAANSIAMTDDVVTEQMAEIYVAQGYNDKAIEIFQQLCLKYPEKSTYFAAQIERISKGLNN